MGELTLDAMRVVSIDKLDGLRAGGKAEGLKRLGEIGLKVPPALVVLHANNGDAGGRSEIRKSYRMLGGGPVAVRSSAWGEDGTETSAAGQYESFLNVTGVEQLEEAVLACFRSADTERVAAYRESMGGHAPLSGGPEPAGVSPNSNPMAVVVQKMVPAAAAGVVFTVNPVGSKNEIVIEAAAGLGDKLVGGFDEGSRYVLPKTGPIEEPSTPVGNRLLDASLLEEIRNGALEAEKEWGIPLDMEWAVDGYGTLHWLQARPVTTVEEDSLDTPLRDDELITRCNIGEMLPGAATPLTLSVFVEPLDWGLKEMYRREGVLAGLKQIPRFISHVENHLFMNLTSMNLVALSVAGASREAIELNVLGRVLPPYEIGKKKPGIVRLINGLRDARIILGHNKYMKRFKRLGFSFKLVDDGKSPGEIYHDLCTLQEKVLNKAYFYHYCISSFSGVMNSILASVLSGGSEITTEAHARMSTLLTNISEIESADVLAGIRRIADSLREYGKDREFLSMETAVAHDWIRGYGGGAGMTVPCEAVSGEFQRFIERHGHRCIREAELRSRDYETYPEEVVRMIADTLKAGGTAELPSPAGPAAAQAAAADPAAADPAAAAEKKVPKWILNSAKEGVRQREYSKSMLILVQHQFKLGYRRLAQILTEEGVIPDEDLIYFFTRDEIGELVESKASGRLVARALKRRNELPYKMELVFPEVSWGRPEPVSHAPEEYDPGSIIQGTPVSSGVVEGTVRVVKRLEEAYGLERGEIMVASFTDIGWTPFFSIISGLVTEIGGALSHGAVVAREYGMPMVSNLPGITGTLKTGMRIRIDGRAGTITLLDT